MEVSADVESDAQAAKEELLSGEAEAEVNLGPMGEGPPTMVDADFVGSVEYEVVEDPELGRILEATVELDVPPWVYDGERQGNAVYEIMRAHGFDGPDGSPRHGTLYGENSITIKNYYELGDN